ncbi:calpain family cysteine protease [Colletotrichum filicis]|nr:calpain family cysteine protease [Colletotrichum filicis]
MNITGERDTSSPSIGDMIKRKYKKRIENDKLAQRDRKRAKKTEAAKPRLILRPLRRQDETNGDSMSEKSDKNSVDSTDYYKLQPSMR